jgi:hypothetical protein
MYTDDPEILHSRVHRFWTIHTECSIPRARFPHQYVCIWRIQHHSARSRGGECACEHKSPQGGLDAHAHARMQTDFFKSEVLRPEKAGSSLSVIPPPAPRRGKIEHVKKPVRTQNAEKSRCRASSLRPGSRDSHGMHACSHACFCHHGCRGHRSCRENK